MVEHLSKEKLNLLFNHQLRGKEFVEALKHIESCEECRKNYPHRPAKEIIQALIADAPNIIESSSQTKEKRFPVIFSGWKIISIASFALLLMVAGVSFWVINTKYRNQVVKVANSNQIPIWQDGNLNANSSVANIPSNSNVLIASNKTANSVVEKPTQSNVSESENSSPPQIATVKTEKSQLQRFLTTIPLAVANLRSSVSNIRSGQGNLKGQFLAPFSEVVRDTKVDFSWASIKDAVDYEITIFDKTYNEIAKEVVQTNSFRLKNALKRGKIYFWKLVAINSKGEILPAKDSKTLGIFKVASEKTIQQLSKLEQTNNDWKTVNFLIENGMLTEAKNKLGKLSTRFPNDPLIKKLSQRIDYLQSN